MCVSTCVWVPVGAREGIGYPETEVTGSDEPPNTGARNTRSSSLEEQQEPLATELSFQPELCG